MICRLKGNEWLKKKRTMVELSCPLHGYPRSLRHPMQKDKLELELQAMAAKAPQPVVEEFRDKIADY